jgi:hypothetical protein
MTLVDLLLFLQGTGVLGIGAGIFKWAVGVEKRVTVLETKLGVKHGNT